MRPIQFTTTLACTLLALAASHAQAQTVYRIVGPDGKVSFSDQPPPPSSNAKVTSAGKGGSAGSGNVSLPFELKEVVQRYPVTLYTSEDCGPCGAARSLLVTRGVPFDERTIKSNEDIEALQRLSGQNSLPLVSIGSQQLKGFSDAEWSQYLDAAGYPKSAQLPASYRNPPAQPLVAVQPAVATAPPVRSAPTPTPASAARPRCAETTVFRW